MKPSELEIICAREERRILKRIYDSVLPSFDVAPFPRFQVSSDMRGSISPNSIMGHSLGFTINGVTTIGEPIAVDVEIIHDDTWIPVVSIISTEADEPILFVVLPRADSTVNLVMEAIRELVAKAAAKCRWQRENLATLLAGKTDFKVFY